ncbi:hypothetical protein LFL96_19070 [Paraburkholderia sp. D15]|uniref:hypothetical protein n=1 Tax=Paraburkholderia sp. D15 TaxID=2880218 RepID=UPI002479D22D|nr:hypothetical protein [Paraburkholderia sp. D15]WGS49824.1 hypothetical protein LFL96_19070 [Paraburkholderia sp. D15]
MTAGTRPTDRRLSLADHTNALRIAIAKSFENPIADMPFSAWRVALHLVTIHIRYGLNTARFNAEAECAWVCVAAGKGLTDAMRKFQQCLGSK